VRVTALPEVWRVFRNVQTTRVKLRASLAGQYNWLCYVPSLNLLLFNSESPFKIQFLLSSLSFLKEAYVIISVITLDMNIFQQEDYSFVVYNFLPSVKGLWWSH
jgi:hypothetical protein